MHITRKLLSTREGTIGFAVLTAVLAGAILLTFMHGYKRSVSDGAQPVTVLVAAGSLPRGSSGDVLADKGLFRATGFKRDQVRPGAITDPASLRGLVAAHDLVRGQQLTTADFAKPANQVLTKLGSDQRAVTVPLDDAHGMVGQVQAGDRVDVLAGFNVETNGTGRPRPVLRVLLQDVEVLQVPPPAKSGALASQSAQNKDVVLRVPERRVPDLTFSSDNGKVWLVLRPPAGAKQSTPSLVTLDRLLLGMDPIPVDSFLAKKRNLINKIYQGDS